MNRSIAKLSKDHYARNSALVLEHGNQHPMKKSFYKDKAELQIRRVVCNGIEELQIEISLYKFGDKRTSQMHHSFIASPEIADMIAKECVTIREKK